MQLIKLGATDSTNAYLKRISRSENLPDFTVVQADLQTEGRGQRGARWEAEKGKNLTFSVLKRLGALPAPRHFKLNAAISLSVCTTLKGLDIPDLHLKWPNDILSGNRKLCGILIENQLKGAFISQSIIGIGLNVNQTDFANLPWATSLKKITGRDFNPDKVLFELLNRLESDLAALQGSTLKTILEDYEAHLYLRDCRANYRKKDGTAFQGVIRGVGRDGQLRLELPDGTLETFGFKELQYPQPGG
jgi:BirA family biotin operon repressor/biotin-[acetyl-CoA-carboxylase] ligase